METGSLKLAGFCLHGLGIYAVHWSCSFKVVGNGKGCGPWHKPGPHISQQKEDPQGYVLQSSLRISVRKLST